jgi:hypothetical protein
MLDKITTHTWQRMNNVTLTTLQHICDKPWNKQKVLYFYNLKWLQNCLTSRKLSPHADYQMHNKNYNYCTKIISNTIKTHSQTMRSMLATRMLCLTNFRKDQWKTNLRRINIFSLQDGFCQVKCFQDSPLISLNIEPVSRPFCGCL